MTHLSREELGRWWTEGAPADRERIVGHLAVCDICATLYGQVIDERAVEVSTTEVPPELVAAGYAAYRPAPLPARPRILVWPTTWRAALGAAAVIALGILSYPLLRQQTPLVPPVDETVRSTTIQTLSPAATVTGTFAFEWSSPIAADAYELTVFDGSSRMVWSTRVETTRLEAPAELVQRLEPGVEHSWQVTAIDREGQRTIQSPRQPFLVSPRGP